VLLRVLLISVPVCPPSVGPFPLDVVGILKVICVWVVRNGDTTPCAADTKAVLPATQRPCDFLKCPELSVVYIPVER
jgi:hypothetical protein